MVSQRFFGRAAWMGRLIGWRLSPRAVCAAPMSSWRLAVRAVCLAMVIGCGFAPPAGADFYWSNPNTESLSRSSLEGSGLQTLLSGEPVGYGIAVGGGYIYWTWEKGIGRAKLDGSEPDKSFISGEGISDVAVGGEYLYWSGGGGNIGRAKLNGSEAEPHFITEIPGGGVDGVAVNNAYIYWTNFWSSAIGRARLNGTEILQEWVKGTHTPEGLAVSTQYVYWAITYENHIGRANINTGTEVTTNFISSGLSSNGNEDVGLAVDAHHIYWANPTTGTIGRANLNGTEIEPSFIADAGAPLGLTLTGPESSTQPATEVASESATANGTVNPEGAETTECVFEYGLSTSYGSSVPCYPSPGSGEAPVAVSGSLTGLSPDTTYHFRVSATGALGTGTGEDEKITTLAKAASKTTESPSEPAVAKSGKLTAEASGGKGTITVGEYGSEIGGPPLFDAKGYIDVNLGSKESFAKVKIEYCELNGAKAIWWDNSATGWEPIPEPPALYSEGNPPCITVTLTESTKPSLKQLTGTRFGVGEAPQLLEYGKCEAAKDAVYAESGCATVAEKKGVPDHKGKYEWYTAPVGCYAQKDGNYTEASCKTVAEKKGVPDHKGKYEKGASEYAASAETVKLEITGAPAVECESASASGEVTAPKLGTLSITFKGCKQASKECSSAGQQQAGTIKAQPLLTELYETGKRTYTGLVGEPIAKFSCNGTEYELTGGVSGETTGDLDSMNSASQTTFKAGTGEQLLHSQTGKTSVAATLTMTLKTSSTQQQEINVSGTTKG